MRRYRARTMGALLVGLIIVPIAATVANTRVEPTDLVESMAFLESYRSTGGAQNAEFYELYSDRAVVHLRNATQEHAVTIQGRALKQWGRQLLASGKTALDASVFHEATVEQRDQRLIIRAKRYSTTRCYWDLGYQVGIEREGSAYRIIEEHLTTNSGATCLTERPLAMPGVSPSGTLGNPTMTPYLRLPVAAATSPDWHPLSASELSAKAHQLADLALARGAATSVGGAATHAQRIPAQAFAPQAERADVRITPQDAP